MFTMSLAKRALVNAVVGIGFILLYNIFVVVFPEYETQSCHANDFGFSIFSVLQYLRQLQ